MSFPRVNFLIILICLFCFSCINDTKEKKSIESVNKIENDNCVLSADFENTQVIWGGYKTTDKIKVTGKFKRFKSAKIQKKNQYKSIRDLIEGLDFAIDVGTSFSGDEIRDANLRDFFFNFFAKNLVLTGKFEKLEGDSINVLLKLFGQEKRFKLNTFYENDIVHVKGHVNLIEQLGAKKAFDSISNKCADLHKGPDGVTRTWEDVEIYIKAPIITICN